MNETLHYLIVEMREASPYRGLGGGMGIEGGLASVALSGAQKQVLLINYTIKVLLLRSSVRGRKGNEDGFPIFKTREG